MWDKVEKIEFHWNSIQVVSHKYDSIQNIHSIKRAKYSKQEPDGP